MSTTRPKPRRERVRLELIVPEPRFQLRAYPDGATFDEDYVRHLLDVLADGGEFDPLELVEEDRGKGREPLRHLIDGMNRHEAYRRAGVGTVEVLVFAGTARDAELWALSSNSRHGRARTPEDCRKAFDRLMSSAVLLERVIADRGRFQGTERSLAAACGLSHGIIGRYLRERGLRVDRLSGKLVDASGPLSPERDSRQQLVAEGAAAGKTNKDIAADLGVSPRTVGSDRRSLREAAKTGRTNLARAGEGLAPTKVLARAGEQEQPAPAPEPKPEPVPALAQDSAPPTAAAPAPVDPRKARAVEAMLANPTAAAEATVEQIVKDLAALAKKVDEVSKSGLRDQLERIAKTAGVPFELAEVDTRPLIPRPGDSLKKVVRSWPALATLQGVFSQLVADLEMAKAFGQGRD